MKQPLHIAAWTLVNALGRGKNASRDALLASRSGLRPCDFEDSELDTWLGRVDGLEDQPVNGGLAPFDCRNNRLADAALEEDGFKTAVAAAVKRHGALRVGVFVGTSTSGIRQTELAYQDRDADTGRLPHDFQYRYTHNTFSAADFTRRTLGLRGPCLAVSTACSSSAKVFAVAARYIEAGFCDAAVVGGVDTLCLTTLYGFNSLELVSSQPCKPWDKDRNGLSIGEAAAFALLEPAAPDSSGVTLLGYGESSDAWHMSAPHPQGEGAARSMQMALVSAELEAGQVDYVNLHGTATPANDRSEDAALTRVFGKNTPCSSTKGLVGHTLGAAGITEALFCCIAIESGLIPATINTLTPDPDLRANIQLENQHATVNVALSNSFGFGGNNCSLVLGRV